MPTLLIALYIACELIANTTASKIVALPGQIYVPAAVFIYALTFTLIDLINERLGAEGARKVVISAFAANLLLAGYVQFARILPPAPFYQDQEAFVAVLGSTPRIVAASLIAYLISSLLDVQVFAWWRERIGRYRWARVLVSNAVSTLVDSAIFVTIAFVGVQPVLLIIGGQYLVKMLITVVSLPLIYTVRRHGAQATA
jgi:uncharacterized integral membrane protein (TIGR00697 family)